MSERITILTTQGNLSLAKTWKADGTVAPYDKPANFNIKTVEVSSIEDLSALLFTLESDPTSCIIRGAYTGTSKITRRKLEHFSDRPSRMVLLDIDGYTPPEIDPIEQPELAIEYLVQHDLPEEFSISSYHWQLSNSFSHPTKPGLRAHLWFWLDQPYTSAQMYAWATRRNDMDQGAKLDRALFRVVQIHYTAAPVIEAGAVCNVSTRSGFVPGLCDDVTIQMTDEDLAGKGEASTELDRKRRASDVDDPVVDWLAANWEVFGMDGDGRLHVRCPFPHESGEQGQTSSSYMPAGVGKSVPGYSCLHETCRGRHTVFDFLRAVGYDRVESDFEIVREVERRGIPQAQHLTTDQANATRIVTRFGKKLFVVGGQWYAWTGMRWERDEGEVYRYACRLSAIISEEAKEWLKRPTKNSSDAEMYADVAKALEKWAQRSEMKSSIDASVGLAKKMLTINEDQINKNPWLLNCLNGIVDLRTGEMKSHDPDEFITLLAPVEYNPKVRSTTWESVLAKVTLESERGTKPLANFMQRWFGYCATGSTREQSFVIHYGQGSNGKSTILDTVAEVLGDYAATAAPGLLVSNGKDRHPTELADLFGRRMVTAHETSEGGVLREDTVKQITGSDKVKARFMRADFFEFDPTHKIQMLTNHKPVIKGQDNGIWRRVLLVPYLARFASADEVAAGRAHYSKDTKVAERLKSELQGVLTWIVEGAKEWAVDGLQAPEAVLAASKDYQIEQDRVQQFVNECCEVSVDHTDVLQSGDFGVYPEYRRWCTEGGVFALSKQKFTQELERVIPYMRQKPDKTPDGLGGRRKVQRLYGLRLSET